MRKIKVKYFNPEDKQNAKKMEKFLNWCMKQPEFKNLPARKIYEKLIKKQGYGKSEIEKIVGMQREANRLMNKIIDNRILSSRL